MFDYSIEQIKVHASNRWPEILLNLAPHLAPLIKRGKKQGPCLLCGGKDRSRCHNDFNETGGVFCNQCGGGADGIATLQWANSWTFREALEAVSTHLGFVDGYIPSSKPIRKPEPPPEKDRSQKRRWIETLWGEATPDHPRLRQYLQFRGLNINPPESLRLHEGLKYLDDKKRSPGVFPCMIAKIIRGYDLVGLHVTFLDRDNPEKADVPVQKKIWGCADTVSGGSIRLFNTEPHKPLALCEGIETALGVMEMMDIPVWSCLNAGMLEKVEIPESVSEVIICGDLDRNNRGQKAMERLAERLHAEGLKVKTTLPLGPIPDDNNDIDWLDVLVESREVAHV